MKTISLLVMLITFPWNQSAQPSENVLAEGVYTATGYTYSEQFGEQNSPCAAQSYYIQIYESKIVQTVKVVWAYEAGEYVPKYGDTDFTYTYQGTNSDGYRVYRQDETRELWVDANYDIVSVFVTSEYSGRVRHYNFGQVIKGDHTQEFLQKCQQHMDNSPFFLEW